MFSPLSLVVHKLRLREIGLNKGAGTLGVYFCFGLPLYSSSFSDTMFA